MYGKAESEKKVEIQIMKTLTKSKYNVQEGEKERKERIMRESYQNND